MTRAEPGALDGRHAIVTGGGSGIGAAVARALLAEGARVTIVGRNAQRLADTAGALATLAGPGRVQSQVADVASSDQVRAAFDRAAAAFGPASVLVNNAGQASSAPLAQTDDALWSRMIEVNLTGTFVCTRAALEPMLAARWGRIVNVASTAGLTGYAYVAAYCASKHGVIGLTRALALEVARRGVTVNAVCPGYTDTELVRESIANIRAKTGRSEAEALAELVRTNPQGRLVQPEEVADAVVWLCRPGAQAVTGQAISVSGGEVAVG